MCPRVNKSKSPEQCQPVQFTIQWSRKLSFVCKANLGCQWSHGRSIRARTPTHTRHTPSFGAPKRQPMSFGNIWRKPRAFICLPIVCWCHFNWNSVFMNIFELYKRCKLGSSVASLFLHVIFCWHFIEIEIAALQCFIISCLQIQSNFLLL